MRIMAMLLLGFAMSLSFAKSKTESVKVTRIKSGGAAIFKSEAADNKTNDLQAGDEVTLLKSGKARSLVKTSGGIRGWVDNSSLEQVSISSGGTHNLKDVEVVGWLDNPSAVYILDNANPDVNALPIDRSFASEIVEKKDREEVERIYDEN